MFRLLYKATFRVKLKRRFDKQLAMSKKGNLVYCVFQIFISHFYISHSNVNEISYFKDCQLYTKTSFEFHPEGGFIKKPKHVTSMIF
jgi:hypothetical protein